MITASTMATRRQTLGTIGALLLPTASASQMVAADDQEEPIQEPPDPRRASGDEELWSLTVNLIHAETGAPVCAYLNPYSWGTDEYLGEQGPTSSATWDNLSTGEYELWAYGATSDWSSRESVWIDDRDGEVRFTVLPTVDTSR